MDKTKKLIFTPTVFSQYIKKKNNQKERHNKYKLCTTPMMRVPLSLLQCTDTCILATAIVSLSINV